jgi:hypothetical protein
LPWLRKVFPIVGFVNLGSEAIAKPYAEALRSGLMALGYTEGKNITLYCRFAEGNVERLCCKCSGLQLAVCVRVTIDQDRAMAHRRGTFLSIRQRSWSWLLKGRLQTPLGSPSRPHCFAAPTR